MTERVPDYFLQFRCTADKCTDSCCLGWEIDIDEDTLERYKKAHGGYAEEIRRSICYDGTPHFALLGGARCPHLNKDGLCDIIINLGEDWLCDICREHPRYYNEYGRVREGGLGLCCESACELIIRGGGMPAVIERDIVSYGDVTEDEDTELTEIVLSSREVIYSIIFDTSIQIPDIFDKIADFAERLEDELFFNNRESAKAITEDAKYGRGEASPRFYEKKIKEIIGIIAELEAKEESFTAMLKGASEKADTLSQCFRCISNEEDGYIRRLLFYFIHRYYALGSYDLRIGARAKIAIFSTIAIFASYKSQEVGATLYECAREYSKNAEYSDENTELYLDLIYDSEL